MNKTYIPALLACVLSAGCLSPVDEPVETETVGVADAELRAGIIIWFIEYDARAEEFTVGVEVDEDVIDDPDSRYLVAELRYDLRHGAGVSPFSANPMDRIYFRDLGRGRFYTELTVSGPPPRNIDDVLGYVSANPTPHP